MTEIWHWWLNVEPWTFGLLTWPVIIVLQNRRSIWRWSVRHHEAIGEALKGLAVGAVLGLVHEAPRRERRH